MASNSDSDGGTCCGTCFDEQPDRVLRAKRVCELHTVDDDYELCKDCTSQCTYCARPLPRIYEYMCDVCENRACIYCCGIWFDEVGVNRRVCLGCTGVFVQKRLEKIAADAT